MNIETNDKLISRNSRIAQVSLLGGLIVLVGGAYLFVSRPDDFGLIWGAVLLGFVLSQVGIYYTNRYGRRPRPDEQLNQALKGLSDQYTLYHYKTPTSHFLLGPSGGWVLLPRYQRGKISYDKGRWRQRGGGFLLTYLKIFGQESLGRPDLEVEADIAGVRKFLAKRMPDSEVPPIQAALVFTDPRVELDEDGLEQAPYPTVQPKKLKDVIRKAAKVKPISPEKLKETRLALAAE